MGLSYKTPKEIKAGYVFSFSAYIDQFSRKIGNGMSHYSYQTGLNATKLGESLRVISEWAREQGLGGQEIIKADLPGQVAECIQSWSYYSSDIMIGKQFALSPHLALTPHLSEIKVRCSRELGELLSTFIGLYRPVKKQEDW
jgi:hypothetical protein